MDAPLPLRRNPDYLRYWLARLLAVFGSQVTYISFPLLALSVADSVWGASLVTVVTYGMPFLVAVPAGYVADRLPRRPVMVTADLVNSSTYLTVGTLAALDQLPLPLLVLAAGLVSATSSVFMAASTALLPTIVGERQIRRAVSVNDSRDFAIALAAPVIGAALFLRGVELPFLVNGVALFMSALCVSLIHAGGTATSSAPERARFSAAFRGVAIVWGDRSLRLALVMLSVLSFVLALNFFSLIVYFEGQGQTLGSGFLVASQALGGLLGGLLAAWLSAKLRPRLVYLLQGSMWAATGWVTAVWHEVWLTAIVLCLTWVVTPAMRAVYQGYVAHAVPEDQRGRVASVAMLATSMMSPFGVVVAGLLGGEGSLIPFTLVGAIAATATLWFLLATIRLKEGLLHVPCPVPPLRDV